MWRRVHPVPPVRRGERWSCIGSGRCHCLEESPLAEEEGISAEEQEQDGATAYSTQVFSLNISLTMLTSFYKCPLDVAVAS